MHGENTLLPWLTQLLKLFQAFYLLPLNSFSKHTYKVKNAITNNAGINPKFRFCSGTNRQYCQKRNLWLYATSKPTVCVFTPRQQNTKKKRNIRFFCILQRYSKTTTHKKEKEYQNCFVYYNVKGQIIRAASGPKLPF